MSYELTGTLHKKFDTEQKSGTFKAREFVVLQPGDYPQYIKFQLVQDRCEMLDRIEEGTEMTVYFDVRGREHNGKYFTSLNAWKIQAQETPF